MFAHSTYLSISLPDYLQFSFQSMEETRSEPVVSTCRRLKQTTIPCVISSSDEPRGETEDQTLLNIIEEVPDYNASVFRTGSDRPASSAYPISEKQASTSRGRGGGRRGLGSKAHQRGSGRTRRTVASTSEISDTDAISIDSGESNDLLDISFDFRRKRGRRG